ARRPHATGSAAAKKATAPAQDFARFQGRGFPFPSLRPARLLAESPAARTPHAPAARERGSARTRPRTATGYHGIPVHLRSPSRTARLPIGSLGKTRALNATAAAANAIAPPFPSHGKRSAHAHIEAWMHCRRSSRLTGREGGRGIYQTPASLTE